MAAVVILALGLLCSQARSQLPGPGLLSGLLGLENGIFGPGLQLGSLPQPSCAVAPGSQPAPPCSALPPFGIPVPPRAVQVPPCTQQPPCAVQQPPCAVQQPPCAVQQPPCGIQVPPCGVPTPSCALHIPPNGLQVPPCGVNEPPCSIQVPSVGIPTPPCGIQSPVINSLGPAFIPNQVCAQCGSFVPNQQCSQFSPNLPPITIPACSACDYGLPQANSIVASSVIDNSLANTLANALQLLLVSNLLEGALSGTCCNTLSSLAPICDTVSPYPSSNVIEILTPDYCPFNQIVSCEPVYESVYSPRVEVPVYQDSFAPCGDVSPCGPVLSPTFIPDFTFDSCGAVSPYVKSCGCSDCGKVNPFGSLNSNCGSVKSFSGGLGCLDSVFSPVAAEVLFPAEIPAQLTCNFGYMPTHVPCVSVNVEPLPFDRCCPNNGLFL